MLAGRFTVVVLLDSLGCCLLAAGLAAVHRRSQRPQGPPALRGRGADLGRAIGLLGFALVGIAVAVSYNVQVAGQNAVADTTNITVHCENGKANFEAGRDRR